MKTVFAKAPGRLDFLGGVADYSGSLVLEMPIRLTTRVTICLGSGNQLTLSSRQEGIYSVPLSSLRILAGPKSTTARVRLWFQENAVPHWATYSLGCILLFARRFRWLPDSGLTVRIDSQVPASMGVSSSAALEVATLRALQKLSGLTLEGNELAHLAQRAENELVGAPCGLMDQLASAYGLQNRLLPILCRPDHLGVPVRLPAGFMAVGWPSGVKHAVSASPYATARAAAFMGRKLVEKAWSRKFKHAAELTPSELQGIGGDILPEKLTGSDFLALAQSVDDPLTRIVPSAIYPIRAGLSFPVEENHRAHVALQLLRSDPSKEREMTAKILGELLYQSHAGYSSIGLGCPETDRMVAAVRSLGPAKGFYGARVSGGGSGGTVVVFLKKAALPRLRKLTQQVCFHEKGPLPLVY